LNTIAITTNVIVVAMNIIANTTKRKLAQKMIKIRKRGTNMKQS
jgi:hypothetical protein